MDDRKPVSWSQAGIAGKEFDCLSTKRKLATLEPNQRLRKAEYTEIKALRKDTLAKIAYEEEV